MNANAIDDLRVRIMFLERHNEDHGLEFMALARIMARLSERIESMQVNQVQILEVLARVERMLTADVGEEEETMGETAGQMLN